MASEGRHDDLPSISVRRPVLAIVANLLIVLAGLAAILGVEVRELPQVERPVVSVNVDFPGAAPETMDSEVTRVLEGAAARVPGLQSISSASEENNARMRLEFYSNVDIDVAANDVREAVAEIEDELPAGVENLVVVKANDESDPIIRLAVSSPTLDSQELTKLVEDQVTTELLAVPGVADVQLYGERARTLNVVVDPQRLASRRLSVDDLAAALESANLDVPAGSVETAEQNLLVRADATVIEEAQIERIIIREGTRISDVASVFYGPEEATSRVRMNGEPVIGLGIVRQPQSNTVRISQAVDQAIVRLNRQLDEIDIVKTSDDAIFIEGAVGEVLITFALVVATVFGVILLFIGSLRLTMIPAVTIPVALIGTLAAIWLLGFSVNLLTLLALVLATGLVVDDAIVVLENIERVRRSGQGRLAAAVLGTRQVFFAVIATTITLASVFVPIAFLPGQAGGLFLEFGLVLAIAVIISTFVALSLCPMLASRLSRAQIDHSPGPLRRPLVRAGTWARQVYESSLAVLMRVPLLVAGLALGVATGVAVLFQALDRELVPDEDRGLIVVYLQGPDGVNLEYSDRQVTQVENLLQPLVESGEAENIFAIAGRYDLHRGAVVARLAPWGERRSQQEIAESLQPALEEIPGALAVIGSPSSLNLRSGGSELEFAVTGQDYAEIAAAAESLIRAMETRMPELRNATMEYSATQPQLSIRIDRERASDLGIEINSIASTLRAMIEGSEIAELNVRDQTVPIRIESQYGAVNDTDDLRNLYIATSGGRMVPLSSLIEIVESGAATELEREGQQRAIQIEADIPPDMALQSAVAEVEALAAETLPAGHGIILLGEAEALEQAEREMMIAFGIALIVVLLVLAAQFESFASALAVMVTVPLGVSAAVLALWLSGTTLNVYSQIGFVMMIGLIAKNGILVVEFANQLRDQGHSVEEAALGAASVRLRPVMMTMLATTLAALPLVLSTGPGAEARNSVGWVIFGGLGIAMLAIIYVTPIAYRVLAPLARSRAEFTRALEAELGQQPSGYSTGPGRAGPLASGD